MNDTTDDGFTVISAPATGLVPGTRYRITLDDCCIRGTLTGTFKSYILDEDGDSDEAVFDIGTIGPMWGSWTVEVVPDA